MNQATPLPRFFAKTRLATDLLPVILLSVAAIAAAMALLPLGTSAHDMQHYFLPWMEIVQRMGAASLSSEFADYTPPYIYLMYLASWLVPLLGPVATIKLINVPFVLALSFAIYHIVLRSTGVPGRAALAAAVVSVAPTLLVNAFAWGQVDVIYTSFLAGGVLFAIKRAPIAAASMVGMAVAFKLQAIFLCPFLLYLILAKQMKIWHLGLVPAVYLVMMVPAALAGRPWLELLAIHVDHAWVFTELAIHAPNPWRIVNGLRLMDYRTGLAIGSIAAGLGGIAIAAASSRLKPSPSTIVLVAAVSSALMPYLLPKMHERYFFVADVMTITLAFVTPAVWVVAPLMQVGSLLSYLPYFGLSSRASVYAVVPVTLSVVILVWEYTRAYLVSQRSRQTVEHISRYQAQPRASRRI